MTTTDVDDPHREPHRATFSGGLWFATTGPGLHVFNALDENGLSTTCEPEARRPLLQAATHLAWRLPVTHDRLRSWIAG